MFYLRSHQYCNRESLHLLRRWIVSFLSLAPFILFFSDKNTTAPYLLILLAFIRGSKYRKYPFIRFFLLWVLSLQMQSLFRPSSERTSESEPTWLIPTHTVFYYLPFFWITTLSAGIERGMKCASSGRAMIQVPSSYYVFVMLLGTVACFGDHWENPRSIIESIFMYDFWFFLIGISHGSLIPPTYSRLELIVWIFVPYLTCIFPIFLWFLDFLFSIVGLSFWAKVPAMFTITNVILRLHLSLYGFFSNMIAISLSARNPPNFVKHGGLLLIYVAFLCIIAFL